MNKDVAGLVARLEGEKIWITQPRPANELELEAASTIRALDAKLREAVEVVRAMREEIYALLAQYDDHEQSNHPHVYVLLQRATAFLAAMEKTDG